MDTDDDIRVTENDLPQEFILKLLGQYEARGLWGIKHTREPVDVMVAYAKAHELSLPIVQLVVTKEGVFMSPIQCRLDNEARENISIRKMEPRHYSDRRIVNPKILPIETWNDDGVVKPRLKPSSIAQNLLRQMKENYVECENKRTVGEILTKREENKKKFECLGNKKKEEKKSLNSPTDLQLLEKYSRFDWRRNGIFFFGVDTISYGVQDLIFTRVFSMIVVNDKNKANGNRPFMCHAFVCESRSTARRVTYALAAAFQAYGRSMKFIREPEKPLKNFREDKPKKITIELRPANEIALNDSEV